VRISYPCDLTAQMLEYSQGTVPGDNSRQGTVPRDMP
jgi:hypothetical protein